MAGLWPSCNDLLMQPNGSRRVEPAEQVKRAQKSCECLDSRNVRETKAFRNRTNASCGTFGSATALFAANRNHNFIRPNRIRTLLKIEDSF